MDNINNMSVDGIPRVLNFIYAVNQGFQSHNNEISDVRTNLNDIKEVMEKLNDKNQKI